MKLGKREGAHIWLIPALTSNDPGPREHDRPWLLQFSFSVASEGIGYPRSGHLKVTPFANWLNIILVITSLGNFLAAI